ncbi:MAG TPA: zinc-binding dehydrogenase [Capsulimonadaceae bacterium]
MQTQAIVFTATNRVELQTIDMPPPGPGEVQIRTLCSAISAGTEGWVLANEFTWDATHYPCVPGYQRVGEVIAIGEGVSTVDVGDRVCATTGSWSGAVGPQWGSHAAVANTLEDEVYQLPDTIDNLDAAGVVVAQVGFNAASRVNLNPGDWVAVYGDGLIGQFAAQWARARGARVVLVGRRADRLALAAEHSADGVVNSRAEDACDAVRQCVGGDHVTAVIDTVQTEAAQVEYLPLLKHGEGQIVYTGFTPGATWADMGLLQKAELTTHYVSGWNYRRMHMTLLWLAAGKLAMRPLITHLVPPSGAPDMYRMIAAKNEPFLAIVIDWRDTQ